MNNRRNESGSMTIVEATIVFPVMFLVIFLMLFAGNAYFQKCRVESIIMDAAIEGAAYCADPMLDDVVKSGSPPKLSSYEVYPYRYFDPNGVGDIAADVSGKIEKKVRSLSTGLFSGMKPEHVVIDAKYNNHFLYSTLSVNAEYKIVIPVRLLGAKDYLGIDFATHLDIPVGDTSEFIRNVDMIEDYMTKTGATAKINEALQKAKEWFGN